MDLIVIYGPPAAGKLTTATALSEITGYAAFHSHLAIDLVNSITPDDKGAEYSEFLFRIIHEVVEFAQQKGQKGLILTTSYTGSNGQKNLLKGLKSLVESEGGRVCFVRLYTTVDELRKRVVDPSRDYYGKIISAEGLDDWLKLADYFAKVDFAESLDIDNTNTPAETVAKDIKSHFGI